MASQHQQQDLIGIIGGMGPLASAAFLSTIYECSLEQIEQNTGRFILYSDPTVPDRTEAFLHHRDDIVYEPFLAMLRSLQHLQVSKIVICCITIHHLLPQLPDDLRPLIISLIDVIFASLQQKREYHLLLCTNGTLQLNIFQRHPLWKRCADYILLPDERDQQAIHALIYQLKAGKEISAASDMVQTLLDKYNVNAFIAGCTEFHLLSRYVQSSPAHRPSYSYIDPLTIVANELAGKAIGV